MTRGTTPGVSFKLDFDTDLLFEAYITISQHGNVVAEHALNACTRTGNKIATTFTQVETLALEPQTIAEVQLRYKLIDGTAAATRIYEVDVNDILKEGVI